MHLYFNEQINLAGSKYVKSVTRLERTSLVREATRADMDSPVVTGKEISSWALVKRWGENCSRHSNCTPLGSRTPFLPRRLIDVGTDSWDQVRLQVNSEDMSAAQYMTLSHRWAGDMLGRLTTENIAQLLCVIPETFLSAVFKDVIIVTRRLGSKYLWIDSLCIIQDSIKDWASESASMHLIYGNSSYNISALAASNSADGLFLSKSTYSPIRINMSIRGLETSYILRMNDTWYDFVTSSPLNLRGWVCQERLLSPRTLHFTSHQLFWECGQLSASEDWPDGVPSHPPPKINPNYPKYILPHDDHGIKHTFSELARADHTVDKVTAKKFWAKVVKLYTRASLTYPTDKLVAISGSWASIVTAVDLASLPKSEDPTKDAFLGQKALIRVLEASLQHTSSDLYGQLKGGHIQVQGRLATAHQRRGEIGRVGFDLDLKVSTELRRHELRHFIVSIEWDTVEAIRNKSEFGKHLYHLLPVRETKLVVTKDNRLSSRVEGLVLKATSKPSEFRRHGVFDWYRIERRREDENWIHSLNDAQTLSIQAQKHR
ncbi:hypothetical protein ONS96_006205 [Cadophora gregata f. sp. sojae]|nr:hypothetical protein ONS96_006205 [Cadophora gregata f. sp. sojae]